ncbi:hypothetical protein HMPREF1555_01892 [Porphyromonas gingivalis F0570]|uniref:Uncharacterized protein n=1 Tax=Porphyromonas gingivalis F0570 TaxID=1227271 RepID=A0A0E2LNW4_PORGN|nr:hypothetical protein HMPREF1555_01892 [Porphyromonas gingivalis F0570]
MFQRRNEPLFVSCSHAKAYRKMLRLKSKEAAPHDLQSSLFVFGVSIFRKSSR